MSAKPTWSNPTLAAFLEQRFSEVDEVESRPLSELRRAYRDAASVLTVFDPGKLRPFGTDGPKGGAFENLVEDSVVPYGRKLGETLWALKLEVRREALRGLISRSDVAGALAANPNRPKAGVQSYLEALLLSEPPETNSLTSEQLDDYLTALEWLDGLMPNLPSVETVRQMRSRIALLIPFTHLLEKGFCGRDSELDRLRNLVGVKPAVTTSGKIRRLVMTFLSSSAKVPPLAIWGVGGSGKSTLIAKFVYEHAVVENQMQFPYAYLDFDSGSVGLSRSAALVIQVLGQLLVQYPEQATRIARFRRHLDRFLNLSEATSPKPTPVRRLKAGTPGIERLNRVEEVVINQLAKLILPIVAPSSYTPGEAKPFLLVLDTFENVQQYSEAKVRKIAAYLRAFVEFLPTMRSVVSGRNRVPELLRVDSVDPSEIPLGDLDDAAAEALLLRFGVDSTEQRSGIRSIAGGNPLNLRLAAQLSLIGKLDTSFTARTAARIKRSLPLGEVLIQGQLYDRVLGAIDDEDVRKLAHPGLALRYLTPQIILEVLSTSCDLQISTLSDAERVFAAVGRYAQLVSPDGEGLRHRADVRRIMLKSLDQDKPALVKQINEKAVAYHAQQEPLVNRAEEIYHRLRLNQARSEVEPRWRDGVEDWLRGSLGDLSLQAQLYLVEKRVQSDVEGVSKASLQDVEWEMLTSSKVREMLSSGLLKDAENMLNERPDSGSGLLALCRGQVAIMNEQWDEAQRYLDEAQRAAISMDRPDDLESALLLGSNVAYNRGDFATATRLAERAEQVLSPDRRQDRLAWSMVLQYRAKTALKVDSRDLSDKLLDLSTRLLPKGDQTSGMTQLLARQIAGTSATSEGLIMILDSALQPPVSPDLIKALFDALLAADQGDSPEVRSLMDSVGLTSSTLSSSRAFTQSAQENLSVSFARTLARILALRNNDDHVLAQIRTAFARNSEIPVFGVRSA